jgi:hypothetical protein
MQFNAPKKLTRQPQQSVEIDYSNPISRALALCMNGGNSPSPYDCVQSRQGTGGTLSRNATSTGQAYRNANTAQTSHTLAGTTALVTSDGAFTGAFSISILANPASAVGAMMAYGAIGSAAPEFYFQFNGNFVSASTPGQVSLVISAGGTPVGVDAASMCDGNYHLFTAVRRLSNALEMWVDGILVGTSSFSGAIATSARTDQILGYQSGGFGGTFDIALIACHNRDLQESEIQSLAVNPWQLFKPYNSALVLPSIAGGTDTPINPGAGSLAITGYSPSLNQTANQSLTPSSGALAFSGYAPVIAQTANQTINPSQGVVAFTGYAPSIAQDSPSPNLQPASGSLTITGYAPVIGQTGGQSSGGFMEVPQVRRRKTVKEDRERLGIIPREVKQVIKAVARATVVAEKTDTQAETILARRLEQQDIEAKAKYAEFMRQERDKLRTQAIARAIQIQRRQKQLADEEDDREVEMLLM